MNDLQKLLALRGIRAVEIARTTGLNYHSVQKCIMGQRPAPHVCAAIAAHLEVAKEKIFGAGAKKGLPRLIAQEIERCAASERERLQQRFLLGDAAMIPNKRRAGNG